MYLTLALLAIGAPAAPANLDFAAGTLAGWEGRGFQLVAVPPAHFATSADPAAGTGYTAVLYRTFVVPSGAGVLRFTAAAVRPPGLDEGPDLDVSLEAPERRIIPKRVHTGKAWQPVARLLPLRDGAQQEYLWDIADLAGQTVRIALVDRDDRPGCHVVCSGFRLAGRDDQPGREFSDVMTRLARDHRLNPMTRYDSKHFLALSNAADGYVEDRLSNCETVYELFFPHFRKLGFTVREPAGKLMVAIFDSQAGFEAYLGQPMSTSITGIYHTPTNRLVVYDFAQNRAFVDAKRRGEQRALQIRPGLQQQQYLGASGRYYRNFRDDLNIATMVHEVAHQLSFNGGLLNRDGDAPVWLVEGLACYCEATGNGGWQGIGEPNPLRAGRLAKALKAGAPLTPLRSLVGSDDWLRKGGTTSQMALGYAQSWALVRMLMEERPADLRRYLALIYSRRTSDHRLADFGECFGDLARLEVRHTAYVRTAAATQARPER